MKELNLTLDEAKRFILYKQGLLGDYRFSGKSGILDKEGTTTNVRCSRRHS